MRFAKGSRSSTPRPPQSTRSRTRLARSIGTGLGAVLLAVASATSSAAADIPPRTTKSCGGPVPLPLSESFSPSTTVTMYSLPFHAAENHTVTVDVAAELDDPSGNPSLGTIGVGMFQCCDVSDSEVRAQQVGNIGAAGSPVHTHITQQLPNKCSLPTKVGTDFVYYLRLRIASSSQSVHLSYSVT
ncbi:hypothetical protein [Streptomyces cinnamoneus]|nr:hypothetical protein [Streptomyces cinnamoneus]